MHLSETSLADLEKIIEEEYEVSLNPDTKTQLLKSLAESLLNLTAAAIKARSRASRLGVFILPSCLKDVSVDDVEQQSFSFEDPDVK